MDRLNAAPQQNPRPLASVYMVIPNRDAVATAAVSTFLTKDRDPIVTSVDRAFFDRYGLGSGRDPNIMKDHSDSPSYYVHLQLFENRPRRGRRNHDEDTLGTGIGLLELEAVQLHMGNALDQHGPLRSTRQGDGRSFWSFKINS